MDLLRNGLKEKKQWWKRKGKRNDMQKEEEVIKKRFIELSEKSYTQNVYTFTAFLNQMEQNVFYETAKQLSHIPYSLYGGDDCCERQMVRFGSEELFGYEEPFPVVCLSISPLSPKFSEAFTHRDFLGALLNLGIQRNLLGDIYSMDRAGYVFCQEKIAAYICENLTRVKHTSVHCKIVSGLPGEGTVTIDRKDVTAASERVDVILAAVYKLSRNQSAEQFRSRKVFVNGRLMENFSYQLKEQDVVSLRGTGKFVYLGKKYETKKGRLAISVGIYR